MLAGGNDLLHDSDPVSLGGVEGVGRQHPSHCVTPASGSRETNSGTAEWINPPIDFELREGRSLIRDHDISGECELDAQCEDLAMHRDNQWLGQLRPIDLPWIDPALGCQGGTALNLGGHTRQVQTGGEHRALAVQDGGP